MVKTSANYYLSSSQDDLYRFGNSSNSRLDHVRDVDVDMFEQQGVTYVCANGRGISLVTKAGAAKRQGWVWILPKGTTMPPGLALNPDKQDHVSLCPTRDMPLDEFISLLLQVAVHCRKVGKQ